MRRLLPLILATTLGAATASCSTPADELAGRGTGIAPPAAANAEPTPAADGFVTGVAGLLKALSERVIAAAGVVRPVKYECGTTVILPTFTCTVVILDQVVTYQVTTKPRGGGTFTWDAKPDSLVATRAGIEAAVWRKYSPRATALTCDTDLPDVQRIVPGDKVPQHCYVKPTAQDAAYGLDSDNRGRTLTIDIAIYDGSIGLTERRQ